MSDNAQTVDVAVIIRYPINSPAAMSNFKHFSGGNVSGLTLRAWKEEPEKGEENRNESKGYRKKRKKIKMEIANLAPVASYVEKMGETELEIFPQAQANF